MSNIFTSEVYGWTNIEDSDRKYAGKVDKYNGKYVCSTNNPEFWDDYAQGLLRRVVLYRAPGNEDSDFEKTGTMEWFAQEYSTAKLGYEKVYHKVNGHKGDESVITKEDRTVIYDWVDNNGKGLVVDCGTNINEEEGTKLVNEIIERIKQEKEGKGNYTRVDVSINDIKLFKEFQNRLKQFNQQTVDELVSAMNDTPQDFDELFDPIVVIVRSDGNNWINSGIHRCRALPRVKGRSSAPVIFLHESEFGNTPEEIERNIKVFGAAMNPQSRKVKLESKQDDAFYWIEDIVDSEQLDPTNDATDDLTKLRKIMQVRYVDTKTLLERTSNTYVTNWVKSQILSTKVAQYKNKHLISYSNAEIATMKKDNELLGIATVVTDAKAIKESIAVWYGMNRLDSTGMSKAKVILYYKDLKQVATYMTDDALDSARVKIAKYNLPIEIEMLPAFEK
jgi:polyhydroxyalkanoate synthesis regulator phasin